MNDFTIFINELSDISKCITKDNRKKRLTKEALKDFTNKLIAASIWLTSKDFKYEKIRTILNIDDIIDEFRTINKNILLTGYLNFDEITKINETFSYFVKDNHLIGRHCLQKNCHICNEVSHSRILFYFNLDSFKLTYTPAEDKDCMFCKNITLHFENETEEFINSIKEK